MRTKPSSFFFALLFVPLIAVGCDTTSSTPVAAPTSSSSCTGGGGVLSCCDASVSVKPALSYYSSKPATFAYSTGDGEILNGDTPLFASDNNATISGTVVYEDKPFDENGFTGQIATLPVRQAKVEVVDNAGTVTATGTTNDSGVYSITFNVSLASGDVYVRALTDSASTFSATVLDDTTNVAIHAVSSSPATVSAGDAPTVNLSAGESGAGPAFNIFDMAITVQKKLMELSPSVSPPQINIYWYDGSSIGTYYWPQGGEYRIFLLGAPTSGDNLGDSDAYDDTVVIHELGHYVSAVYSRDDSPGGPHTLTGQYDLRLTWSEGWATFFGSMVRNSELYVDANNSGYFSFEIETPTPNSTGADNELAISAILWDINDPAYPTNESFDSLADGVTGIWDIFENRLPYANVATFETFWDAWEAITPGQLAALLTDRDIRYYKDQYETPSDNTTVAARTVSPGISEQHTFFPADDKDYWKINVTSGITYTFRTETLGDGADTVLTIYDSGGANQLAQNDDDPDRASDSNMQWPASSLKCTANSNVAVYLMAEPYKPLVSGDTMAVSRYGYYTLTITAQ